MVWARGACSSSRQDRGSPSSSGATGLVIFAHGSGSSRRSPRNQFVAGVLREAKLGTLLFDLLTSAEERAEFQTDHLRFDIPFLSNRLVEVTQWALSQVIASGLRVGYFGASTGAAAALVAAANLGGIIGAVVSRGGRPDLAQIYLVRLRDERPFAFAVTFGVGLLLR